MFPTCRCLIVWILVFASAVYRSRSSQAAWNPVRCPTACICRMENAVRKVYCDIQDKQRVLTAVPSNFPSDSQFISLGRNKIPTIPVGAFTNLPQLRDLFLNGNGLQSLPRDVFRGLTSLQSLDLSDNRLGILPSGLFKSLSTLRYLYLDGNVLENIPNDFFEGLTSLRRLQLHGNKFNKFSERVFGFRGEFRKFTIPNTESLRLSRLTTPTFGNLSSLAVLTLNHNGIRKVKNGSFDRMDVLKQLKLNDNNISILPQGLFRDLKSLRFLSLYNNPFQCTCALKWLKHWILQYSKSVYVFHRYKITCHGPSRVRGKSLITLGDAEFGCKRRQWTTWSSWSTCSAGCGTAKQSRTRSCTGEGQLKCKGHDTSWRLCDTDCETGWSEWSAWTLCSVSCAVGYQTRNRQTNCSRSPCRRHVESEVRACVRKSCPSHSEWSSWSICDTVCGQGRQNRTRACPQSGGNCSRPETKECKVRECAEWATWSTWSACSNNCSKGVQVRKRDCVVVVGLKKQCPGSSTEERQCSSDACLVHGGWSPWQPWSSCSVTCGLGFRMRQRNCMSPGARHGGAACRGHNLEVTKCVEHLCKDNDLREFTPWSKWSECSTHCGKGVKSRSRNCTILDPLSGLGLCMGKRKEISACEKHECSVKGFWGKWSRWGKCLGDCNNGLRLRWRFCLDNRGLGANTCNGNQTFQYEKQTCHSTSCSVKPVWSNWNSWSECSKSCGSGSRRRWRFCLTKVVGQLCPGNYESKQTCNAHACPIHGGWSPWSSWSECNKGCRGGIQQRNRTCNNPLPKNNGYGCLGDKSEVIICKKFQCMIGDQPFQQTTQMPHIELKAPKVCSDPERPKHGRYSIREQKDGFRYLEYKCDQFFRNSKESTIRYCMQTGQWSGEAAECVPDCGELEKSILPKDRFTPGDHSIMSLEDSWPWQAAIENDGKVVCGGSLIGDQWIITAAHCILMSNTKRRHKKLKVYLGTNKLLQLNSPAVQKIAVVEVHYHRRFNWKDYDSDIAVLKLKRKANITSQVHSVCLPKNKRRKGLMKEGMMGVMVGWGSKKKPNYLRQLPLPVVDLTTCKQSYARWTVTENMLCAGYKYESHDACNRDSGGGFLFLDKRERKFRWVLGGVVSWGYPGCGQTGKYSVFTNVARHMNWITNRIRDK